MTNTAARVRQITAQERHIENLFAKGFANVCNLVGGIEGVVRY